MVLKVGRGDEGHQKTRAPHAVFCEAENSLTCQKAYSSAQLITPKISTQV